MPFADCSPPHQSILSAVVRSPRSRRRRTSTHLATVERGKSRRRISALCRCGSNPHIVLRNTLVSSRLVAARRSRWSKRIYRSAPAPIPRAGRSPPWRSRGSILLPLQRGAALIVSVSRCAPHAASRSGAVPSPCVHQSCISSSGTPIRAGCRGVCWRIGRDIACRLVSFAHPIGFAEWCLSVLSVAV